MSSEEIQVKLESKQRHLEDFTENFIVDSANGDYDKGEQHVQFALNKAALHVCKIVRLDTAILFPDVHKVFLQHVPCDVDSTVSTSKSILLTFLGNEFGELLSSFCCNKKIGTIFHRTNADMHVLCGGVPPLNRVTSNLHTCL